MRTQRAAAWMDLFVFFRERFPIAAQRQPPDSLYSMGQLFSRRDDDLDAAADLLVRESVMLEIEDLLAHTLTYPPLKALLQKLRDNDPQRSADARRLAAAVLGELSGARLWKVRTRLVTTGTRALLAAKPLLDELERGGFKVDRTRSARGFARRLEEAVADLPGAPMLESNPPPAGGFGAGGGCAASGVDDRRLVSRLPDGVDVPAWRPEFRHAGDSCRHQAEQSGDEQPDGLARGKQLPACGHGNAGPRRSHIREIAACRRRKAGIRGGLS